MARHGFELADDDRRAIEDAHAVFYRFGPGIRYPPTPRNSATNHPTYSELMTATDADEVSRGFLATEEAFEAVKNLHRRNLIVPIVGNFAGPKAIRALGTYLRQREAVVSAFYVSNVEEYLRRNGTLRYFCANASTLPFDGTSTFIRAVRSRDSRRGLSSQLQPMAEAVACE